MGVQCVPISIICVFVSNNDWPRLVIVSLTGFFYNFLMDQKWSLKYIYFINIIF